MKTTISIVLFLFGVLFIGSKLSSYKLPEISKYEAVNPAYMNPEVYEKQHDIERLKVELRSLLIEKDPVHAEFKIPD